MRSRPARLVPWIARLAWTAVPLAPGSLDSDGIVGGAAWLTWAIVTLAVWASHPVTLSVCRGLGPVAGALVITSTLDRALSSGRVLAAGLVVVALLTTFGAEFGSRHVQAGAYGAEHRYLLRPPVALLAPTAVGWLAIVVPAGSGVWLAESGRTLLGASLGALASLVCWRLGPRLHRLSRRWLVRVPAGWVVHDEVLLAENLLVRTADVADVSRATVGTDALDLTGLAAGGAVQLTLRRPIDVRVTPLAARLLGLGSDALHVTSFLVAPTRVTPVVEAARRA